MREPINSKAGPTVRMRVTGAERILAWVLAAVLSGVLFGSLCVGVHGLS